jgi:hypothetical protein
MNITQAQIDKIHSLLDYGLPTGLGKPEPGKMCVEGAISYALGLPHSDDPGCVIEPLRRLKIRLNDSNRWTSNKARAEGLRRLAIAQLGSKGAIDPQDFVNRVVTMTIRTIVPSALRNAAKHCENPAKFLEIALKCEQEPTQANAESARSAAADAAAAAAAAAADADAAAYAYAAAYAAAAAYAYAAAYAAAAAADYADAAAAAAAADYAAAAAAAAAADAEKILIEYAENVVQILIDMKAPGCVWL